MNNLIRVTVDGVAKDFDSLEAAKTAYPDGEYVVITDQSPAAKAAIAAKIVRQREWRDSELTRTDVLSLLTDHPQKTEIVAYRKELRDWPSTDDFPLTTPTLGS